MIPKIAPAGSPLPSAPRTAMGYIRTLRIAPMNRVMNNITTSVVTPR